MKGCRKRSRVCHICVIHHHPTADLRIFPWPSSRSDLLRGAFGASALVFQHIGGQAGVTFVLPLVLFLFAVALGTDYNILISDRLREEMAHEGPVRAAVARAVRHTAPAVATAGVVLAGSFGSLAVNADPATRQLDFATALGILLSAFVVSLLLVPAAAALLGRAVWWPVRAARGRRDGIGRNTSEARGHRTEARPLSGRS